MSDVVNGGGGGSPAVDVVAPARLSELGTSGQPASKGARSISDLGMPQGPGAAEPGEKMAKLTNPFGATETSAKEPEPVNVDEIDPNAPVEEPETEPTPEDGQLTPEVLQAKYEEWANTGQVPEEFKDLPIWVPDGKDGFMPVRLGDIHNNVMLYNDYQKKTTEVANERRMMDAFKRGRDNWVNDINSGDADRGLRAMRGVGADKTLEAMVIKFVQNMAALENLPPEVRDRLLRAQKAEDEAYYAKQQLQQYQQQEQERAAREAEQSGANAPDVKFVQDAISKQLPDIYKALKIEDSPLVDHLLSSKLAEAATGVRDPQTGQWITPPIIQLGRAPSREVLTQLVLAAKQESESYTNGGKKRRLAPPPTVPIKGSGPAAKPGQRGNLSAPKRLRISDLANNKVGGYKDQ